MSAHDSEQAPAQQAHLPILGLIESIQEICRAGATQEQFVTELLRGFVALADAHYGAFWAVDAEQKTLGIAAELMPQVSAEAVQGWAETLGELASGVIQQSIIRYHVVGEPVGQLLTGQTFTALGFPVRGQDSPGCITVVVQQENPILSDAGIAMLRLLADLGLLHASTRSAARFEESYRSLSRAWDVVGETLAFIKPNEMAHVLADRSRVAFGAVRSSVGFVKGSKVAVTAISGEDIIDKRSNVVRLIQAVQTEVLVSGEPGLYDALAEQTVRTEQTTRNPQHERLATDNSAGAVYSVPLRYQDDVIGVWTLEFGPEDGADLVRQQVVDVAAGQVGPLLHLSRRNDRGPIRRAGGAIADAAKWLVGKEHTWQKAVALAVIGVGLYAGFGQTDFNVSSSCVLVPSYQRVYAAPFDSTISGAPVRPADTVVPGQLIAELDTEDIVLQLNKTKADLAATTMAMNAYLAEQKLANYREEEAKSFALKAQIDLLERHRDRAELRAERDGVVLSGDLSDHIGRPVRMGDELLVIAHLKDLLLEVEIDQGDIGHIKIGQEGRFTTKSAPDVQIPFVVSTIRPLPEPRQGNTVYVVEATIPNREFARIEDAQKALDRPLDEPDKRVLIDYAIDELYGGSLVDLEAAWGLPRGEREDIYGAAAHPPEEDLERMFLHYVDNHPIGWLRPGLEGAAKVRIGRANVGWVYSRKLVNWVRLRIWWKLKSPWAAES